MEFLRREDGAVALIFGLMAIPFIALVGWSVDYFRLIHVRDYLQAQVDSAAVNALLPDEQWELNANHPEQPWRLAMQGELQREYQGDWARNVAIQGNWLSGENKDFRVTASADVPLSFIKLLPGIGDTQAVAVSAVARLNTPDLIYSPPEFTSLSFEAYDFNRLWLYCFWPGRPPADPNLPRRTQMVPIADNGGSVFTPDPGNPRENEPIQDDLLREAYGQRTALGLDQLDTQEQGIWRQIAGGGIGQRKYTYLMPQCPPGSHLSMRLENVRDALQAVRIGSGSPQRWDTGGNRYNHYTDTKPTSGEPDDHLGIQSVTILETVICDTLDQCMNSTMEGGLIPPTQGNRHPQRAPEGCSQGRYMYYGWEDRPPELGGSDRDYDDIRVVMACPEEVWDGQRSVRLVS